MLLLTLLLQPLLALSLDPAKSVLKEPAEKFFYCTPNLNSLFVKTFNGKVYFSSDNGKTFKDLIQLLIENKEKHATNANFPENHFENEIQVTHVFQNKINPNMFFFTTKQGAIYRTTDCGKNYVLKWVKEHIIEIKLHPFLADSMVAIYNTCKAEHCIKTAIVTVNAFESFREVLKNVIQIDWLPAKKGSFQLDEIPTHCATPQTSCFLHSQSEVLQKTKLQLQSGYYLL